MCISRGTLHPHQTGLRKDKKILQDSNRIQRKGLDKVNELLLAQLNVQPVFFLQPLSYWCEKEMTTAEHGVFHAIDSCPNNFYRLFQNVLGKEIHHPFFDSIRKKAGNIVCHDMNDLLRSSPLMKETIFVDRVHFNDPGNAELARIITPLV